MHRRHLIHCDIKFAKYNLDKTYMFVGSPIFIAPEIICFQGYNRSVDY